MELAIRHRPGGKYCEYLYGGKNNISHLNSQLTHLLKTWTHPEINNVGAGIDSFYEYALKWYILSGRWLLRAQRGH